MIPDWFDAERLQWLLLAAIGGLLYMMYIVTRLVRRALMKFLLVVLLAGLGFSLWIQRADLNQCVDTCSCSLYGQDVKLPRDVDGIPCDSLGDPLNAQNISAARAAV